VEQAASATDVESPDHGAAEDEEVAA
jgi:hypothetical protein